MKQMEIFQVREKHIWTTWPCCIHIVLEGIVSNNYCFFKSSGCLILYHISTSFLCFFLFQTLVAYISVLIFSHITLPTVRLGISIVYMHVRGKSIFTSLVFQIQWIQCAVFGEEKTGPTILQHQDCVLYLECKIALILCFLNQSCSSSVTTGNNCWCEK